VFLTAIILSIRYGSPPTSSIARSHTSQVTCIIVWEKIFFFEAEIAAGIDSFGGAAIFSWEVGGILISNLIVQLIPLSNLIVQHLTLSSMLILTIFIRFYQAPHLIVNSAGEVSHVDAAMCVSEIPPHINQPPLAVDAVFFLAGIWE
jgi:hypothetical protein